MQRQDQQQLHNAIKPVFLSLTSLSTVQQMAKVLLHSSTCWGMLISVPGDHLDAVQTLGIITKHFLTQYFVRHCSPLCLIG